MPAVWPLSCSPVGGEGLTPLTRERGSRVCWGSPGPLGRRGHSPRRAAWGRRLWGLTTVESRTVYGVYSCIAASLLITIMVSFSVSRTATNASSCFLMLSRGTVFSPLSNAFNASVQITTCECRYHGYQRVLCCDHGSLERAYKSYPLLSCSGLCFMYEGFRFEVVSASVHGFTAFARDHTSEPIHLQRVWTLQRSADCRPYGFLGAFFHLSFLHTVLRDSYICQTNAK